MVSEEAIAKLREMLSEDPLMDKQKYEQILTRIHELGG